MHNAGENPSGLKREERVMSVRLDSHKLAFQYSTLVFTWDYDYNDRLAGGQVLLGDGHVQGFGDSIGRTKEEVASRIWTPVAPLGPSRIGWVAF